MIAAGREESVFFKGWPLVGQSLVDGPVSIQAAQTGLTGLFKKEKECIKLGGGGDGSRKSQGNYW